MIVKYFLKSQMLIALICVCIWDYESGSSFRETHSRAQSPRVHQNPDGWRHPQRHHLQLQFVQSEHCFETLANIPGPTLRDLGGDSGYVAWIQTTGSCTPWFQQVGREWLLGKTVLISFWLSFLDLVIRVTREISLSGYNESLLRSKRHQLNESPKGTTGLWKDILTAALMIWSSIFCLGFKV